MIFKANIFIQHRPHKIVIQYLLNCTKYSGKGRTRAQG